MLYLLSLRSFRPGSMWTSWGAVRPSGGFCTWIGTIPVPIQSGRQRKKALGWILVDEKLDRNPERNGILHCIKRSMSSRLRDVIPPFGSGLVRPHLEYRIQPWGPQHKEHMDLLNWTQRRANKMIRGMELLFYAARLRDLGLFSMEKRRLQNNLIAHFQYLERAYRKD